MHSKIKITSLKVEQTSEPIGIENSKPQFSWGFQASTKRGLKQTAYRILVASDEALLVNENADVWDSGKVVSSENRHITYEGKDLSSHQRYVWKVQVWDGDHRLSEWSNISNWSMGLTKSDDWKASWIGLTESMKKTWSTSPEVEPMPLLRNEFVIERPFERVTAYVCGLGQFEFRLNGEKVGNYTIEPGWTDYDSSCLYHTYEITSLMKQGKNATGVMLGNGFYNVGGTNDRYLKYRGSYGLPKVIAQFVIEYMDGTTDYIGTGENWEIAKGPIVFSSVYGGEDYDAREEQEGWDEPDFVGGNWKSAPLVTPPKGKLRSLPFPKNKINESFTTKKITKLAENTYVYDLGENFSGWPYIRLQGDRGSQVKFIPGEVLDEKGFVDQSTIGTPVYFSYTLKGGDEESWSPRFMYHGFRYLQVEGAIPANEEEPKATKVLEVIGEMIYPDLEVVGEFECSNPEWNSIHQLILRSILSNTKSVFTDCPHREKLGWIEQIHLMGPSMKYNYDISTLLEKVYIDMEEAQTESGFIPNITPEYVEFEDGFRDSPEWGSSFIIGPWYHYNWYGNLRILAQRYDELKRYVEYLNTRAEQGIVSHGLGDWGDLGVIPGQYQGFAAYTPVPVTATAMLYYDSMILAKIAKLLGKEDDATYYRTLSNNVHDAFNKEFFNAKSQTYATNSQTSNATTLGLGLAKPEYEQLILEKLITDLEERDFAITSGEIGHRYMLRALTTFRRSDVIVKMLEQSKEPYYKYQVEHGATSLTEFWDGPITGQSQNHIMMGHIEEWFYAGLAGIQIDYEGKFDDHLIIAPYLAEGIDWVWAQHVITGGTIKVEWKVEGQQLQLNVSIPVNQKALVKIPVQSVREVEENGIEIESTDFEIIKSTEDIWIKVDSGEYTFQAQID